MPSWSPGGQRTPRPRPPRAGVSFPAETPNPALVPRAGRAGVSSADPQASSLTSTRPPGPPAQTAAARECCFRTPPPSHQAAAPSPSPRVRMPPCFPQVRRGFCAPARWRGGGQARGRRAGPPRRCGEARPERPLWGWRCTAGAGATCWAGRASRFQAREPAGTTRSSSAQTFVLQAGMEGFCSTHFKHWKEVRDGLTLVTASS